MSNTINFDCKNYYNSQVNRILIYTLNYLPHTDKIHCDGNIIGPDISLATSSPTRAVTIVRANSKQLPGPRLVMVVPSRHTLASE